MRFLESSGELLLAWHGHYLLTSELVRTSAPSFPIAARLTTFADPLSPPCRLARCPFPLPSSKLVMHVAAPPFPSPRREFPFPLLLGRKPIPLVSRATHAARWDRCSTSHLASLQARLASNSPHRSLCHIDANWISQLACAMRFSPCQDELDLSGNSAWSQLELTLTRARFKLKSVL